MRGARICDQGSEYWELVWDTYPGPLVQPPSRLWDSTEGTRIETSEFQTFRFFLQRRDFTHSQNRTCRRAGGRTTLRFIGNRKDPAGQAVA